MSIEQDKHRENANVTTTGQTAQKDADSKSSGKQADRDINEDRTIAGRPADPNRLGAGVQFPPGVDPEDARDPGRATPNAPPVDNRS